VKETRTAQAAFGLDLVPNLPALDRLLQARTDPERFSAVHRQTEQLSYYLRGAFFALTEIEQARINACQLPAVKPGLRYRLPEEKSDPISFALDFYLFCSRRACDAVIPYISRLPVPLSLPSSMNDLADGLRAKKWEIDTEISQLIISFWEDTGIALKGYRDQANHKAIILSTCTVFRTPDGKVALDAKLPDDPNEKSPSMIRYKSDMRLMAFTVKAFGHLLMTVNSIVERLIDLCAPDDEDPRKYGTVSIVMRGGPMSLSGNISGEVVPLPVSLREVALDASRAGISRENS